MPMRSRAYARQPLPALGPLGAALATAAEGILLGLVAGGV